MSEIAGALKNPETFTPSTKAKEAWETLLKEYDGKQVPDEVVKGPELYKENQQWINDVKEKRYDIIDIGAKKDAAKSTFYEMEKQSIEQ